MRLSIILIFCITRVITSNDFMNPKGRYFEAILDYVEILMETPTISEWHVKVRKVNKTRAIVGYITEHVPIGNNIKIEFRSLKKQGGEYRYLPYALPAAPFCDSCSNDKITYPEIAKNSDFPEDIAKHCPLPIGNYTLYGLTFNLKHVPRMAIQSGEYCLEVLYYKDDKHFATYRICGYINNV